MVVYGYMSEVSVLTGRGRFSPAYLFNVWKNKGKDGKRWRIWEWCDVRTKCDMWN